MSGVTGDGFRERGRRVASRGSALLAALVVGVVVSCPADALAIDAAVGHKVERISKPGESRTVDVHLWYPADPVDAALRATTKYTSVYKGIELPGGFSPLSWSFGAELAREGAAVAADGPAFPVIVFSHGSVNDPINAAHLLERIAADGFIVAAPTHVTDTQEDVRIDFINGFINAQPDPTLAAQLPIELRTCLLGLPRPCARPGNTVPARMAERARDVSNTLDALPGWFGSRADMTRVGMLGHSRGTLTGMAAAAGSAAWGVLPEAPVKVKAVMGMASGGTQLVTLQPNLSAIEIPTLVVAGGSDTNSRLSFNQDLFNQIGCEPVAAARPPGCAHPKASKGFVVLDQAHHRTFISTFCDQTKAVGTIAKADPNAVFEIGALAGQTGAQFLTQAASGRAMDYCSPDTFAGWEDLVRTKTTTDTNPAAGGFCITPATVDPGSPCNESGAVPTTGLDEESVKQHMTACALEFFNTKLATDRDGDGVPDTTAYADADGDGTGDACDNHTFGGFLPPVDNPPTINTGRAGKTYPVKFQIRDHTGALVTNPAAVSSIKYKPVSCESFSADPTDALKTTAAEGTSLRWEDDRFVYNWKTPTAAGCYELFVTPADLQTHSANFSLN